MTSYDLHITGGTIVDGTRVPRFEGDLWIKNGAIAQIGGRANGPSAEVIDATGKIVAPGFVDLHTHYDAQIRWDPWCTISGYHGVTSVVLGNCGFGFAPVKPEFRDRSMLTMTRTEAIPYESMRLGMDWDWETIPEYLDSLDRAPKGVNCIQYMPTASLMTYVMGLDNWGGDQIGAELQDEDGDGVWEGTWKEREGARRGNEYSRSHRETEDVWTSTLTRSYE